jgi:hypothetical protein
MKPKLTYYSVHAVPDGTICIAMQARKPSRRNRSRKSSEPDEDGCFNWYIASADDIRRLSDWAKAAAHGAIVNRLNLKKVLRSQIEPRLNDLEKCLHTIHHISLCMKRRGEPSRD